MVYRSETYLTSTKKTVYGVLANITNFWIFSWKFLTTLQNAKFDCYDSVFVDVVFSKLI